MSPHQKLIKVAGKGVLLGLVVLAIAACSSPEQQDLQRGLDLAKNHEFKESLIYFNHAVLRSPESRESVVAAKEGAKIAFFELKDFRKAAEFNQHVILSSQVPEERMAAQMQLATIDFDHLADYPAAVREISRLLTLDLNHAERTAYRLRLAKAYYFQNNFLQAESEAGDFLKTEKEDQDAIFQMILLKGNVALAKKDMTRAAENLRELLRRFPERAVKENVAISLAVAYEEMKDYKNAIAVLEEMRAYNVTPEYIDLRIKKLQSAQKNQPGAQGTKHK
jgi:tetratricopeptide (TPR) repeat protein